MTRPTDPSSAARPSPRRPAPDPLSMTPGEKVMAEWEARHDVAARGSRAVPGAVQHYLSGIHSREACERAAQPPHAPRSAATAAPARVELRTPWWLRVPRG